MAKKKEKRNEEDELLSMLNEENDSTEDEDSDDGDDSSHTEAEISKLSKKKLLALIEEEGLDVDNADTLNVAELRTAVNAELFEEEGEVASEEEDSSDESYTEEDIRGMNKASLLELVAEEVLEIEGVKKLKVPELKNAVVAAYFDEGGATEEELAALSKKELLEFVSSHELDIDGADGMKKKALASAVLEAMSAVEEEEPEEEEEEVEEIKPKAKKGKKGKGKLTQELPIKEGSKRAHAMNTMMQKSRTMEEHRVAAGKSHKKAKIAGSDEYKTVIDRNLLRLVENTFGGSFDESTEDGSFMLLGFDESNVATKPSKNKTEKAKAEVEVEPEVKKGKKNKKGKKVKK